ncbi:MAG: hypothetical protein RBS56_02460 [Candidatus Gracilibacteria bacterium]|jgi:hypothetical protein|nr:hypothetical protein [Candidatus Gracilibacteria bacterium]
MPLKLDYEFLFVGRDENSFLENYCCDFEREHGEKSGQIFANIEIKNNPIDAEDIAVSIYDTMQRVFFENMELSSYERFEITLKEINAVLKSFSSTKNNGFIGDLNVLIGARVGAELFLSQTGDAEAYLIRKRYVSVISDGLGDDKTKDDYFTNVASGTVEASDFVLFTNTRILRYVSKTDLASCIRRGPVVETLTEIRDVVSTEMLGRLGMTGIIFSEAVLEEKELDFSKSVSDVENESIRTEIVEDLMKSDGNEISVVHRERTDETRSRLDFSAGKGKVKAAIFGAFDFMKNAGNSKNKILIVLVAIILVLVVSIFAANGLSDKKKKLENLEKILEGVSLKITEAETKGTYDKEGAAFILDKAYSEALSVHNSGYYRDKANSYLVQINQTRDRLDQVNRILPDNLYIDLKEKDPSIKVLGYVEVDGKRYFYTENKLFEITLDSVLDGISLDAGEIVVDATGFDERKSIVFLTKSGKLMEYREGTVSFMNTEDTTFKNAVAIDDWSNRIYLLDSTEGQIWKYTFKGASEKFGPAEGYFSNPLEEIKNAKDLIIDSYVFVVDADSKLLRYYGGDKSEITIVNSPYNGFKTSDSLFTNETLSNLFVIDDEANRVFVFIKENDKNKLTYMSQYMFEENTDIVGVYSDKDSGKIYILTGNAIYEI